MAKYKITNFGKRGVIVNGNGLSYGQSIITDKPVTGHKIGCEEIIEEEEEKQKPKLKLDIDKKNKNKEDE